MILSAKAIKSNIEQGRIAIHPFNPEQMNPNSYNLRLADEIVEYKDIVLDMARKPKEVRYKIPPEGLVLEPGKLYLARTVEYTETHDFVPMIEGRSSIGRLGMFVHVTAGFGDVGFGGCWTLEIMVAKPLRIYSGVEICQIYFHTIAGDTEMKYTSGKYNGAREVQASMLWKEFQKDG